MMKSTNPNSMFDMITLELGQDKKQYELLNDEIDR